MTFAEAERALDAGKLEMAAPWGSWVRVRRAGRTISQSGARRWRYAAVHMEAEVVSTISEAHDRFGQPYLRIARAA